MTLDQAKELVEELLVYGCEARVMEDYSGRGMYGKSVPAIILESHSDILTLAYLAGAKSESGADNFEMSIDELPTRTDSMGLGVVVY